LLLLLLVLLLLLSLCGLFLLAELGESDAM